MIVTCKEETKWQSGMGQRILSDVDNRRRRLDILMSGDIRRRRLDFKGGMYICSGREVTRTREWRKDPLVNINMKRNSLSGKRRVKCPARDDQAKNETTPRTHMRGNRRSQINKD